MPREDADGTAQRVDGDQIDVLPDASERMANQPLRIRIPLHVDDVHRAARH
jgi:hypothetical protein